MRHATATCLIAAQLAAAPAMAAPSLGGPGDRAEIGTFAGARLRIPLGQRERRAEPLLGLSIGPARHGTGQEGGRVLIGESVSLHLGRGKPELRLAGAPLRALRVGDGEAGEEEDDGIPTAVWIIGGVVVTAVAGYAYLLHQISKNSE